MNKLYPEELLKGDFEAVLPPEGFDVENAEKTPVQLELEDAIAKAKEFHPVTKLYVDSYTGEVNRYKTPDNYVPDEGVVNDMVDLCHTDDHVSIADMYARLKQMHAMSIQDSEFDFSEDQISADDLDDDTLSDFNDIGEDALDGQELEDFIFETYGKPSEQEVSDSAGQKPSVESKNEDKVPEVAANE